MTMVDQLMAAVEASSADAGKKEVAKAFLTAAGPAIEMLGTDLFSQVLQSAAAGAGVEAIVQGLDEKQVVGMLAGVEGEMGALAQSHQADLASRQAAVESLQAAAFTVLARALIGAL